MVVTFMKCDSREFRIKLYAFLLSLKSPSQGPVLADQLPIAMNVNGSQNEHHDGAFNKEGSVREVTCWVSGSFRTFENVHP